MIHQRNVTIVASKSLNYEALQVLYLYKMGMYESFIELAFVDCSKFGVTIFVLIGKLFLKAIYLAQGLITFYIELQFVLSERKFINI